MATKRTRIEAGLSPSNPQIINENLTTSTQFMTQLDLLEKSCGSQVQTLFPVLLTMFKQQQQIIASLQQQNALMRDQNNMMKSDNSAEIKERERSLVLIGLKESSQQKPSDRVAEDNAAVTRVLDELGVQCPISVAYRMGSHPNRATSGHARLVKVVLPASKFRNIALGCWKRERIRLRQMPEWSNLLVRPSLSKEELANERARRAARRDNQRPGQGLDQIAQEMNRNMMEEGGINGTDPLGASKNA